MSHIYTLELEPGEVRALDWARGRYKWPNQLIACLDDERGAVVMSESDAWAWLEDIEEDMVGGHEAFPCADQILAAKLYVFKGSIV